MCLKLRDKDEIMIDEFAINSSMSKILYLYHIVNTHVRAQKIFIYSKNSIKP